MRTLTTFLIAGAALFAQDGFNGPGRCQIANLKSGQVVDVHRNGGGSRVYRDTGARGRDRGCRADFAIVQR